MRTTMLTTDEQVRATIGRALRAKYKSPRDVFKRLGLEHVLKHPRLSYDAKFAGPNGSFSKATLDRLLADDTVGLTAPNEGLSDEEREGVNIEVEQAEDQIQERADRVVDHLRKRGLDEESCEVARGMIEDELRERWDEHRRKRNGGDREYEPGSRMGDPRVALPRNAIGGGAAGGGPGSGFQGRLSQPDWERASVRDTTGGTINSRAVFEAMTPAERREAAAISDRRAARDHKLQAADQRRQRRSRDFENRFTDSARLSGTALESGLTSALERAAKARTTERKVALDSARSRSFLSRFPEASRIGTA